ncbi:MAG TPA: hypothetical protein VM619_14720 [Luteimonas sp.]|nr:hypothetical protein [Luteimonas sp.]
MPDDMDRLQEFNEQAVTDALARHRSTQPARRSGLTHCETLDCREPIEPARTRLGARLCADCQHDADIRARQFARGRGT